MRVNPVAPVQPVKKVPVYMSKVPYYVLEQAYREIQEKKAQNERQKHTVKKKAHQWAGTGCAGYI